MGRNTLLKITKLRRLLGCPLLCVNMQGDKRMVKISKMQVKTVVRSSFVKRILRPGKLLSLLNPSLHCLLNL